MPPVLSRTPTHDLAMSLYYPAGTTDPVERTRTRTQAEIDAAYERIREELRFIGYEVVDGPTITPVP